MRSFDGLDLFSRPKQPKGIAPFLIRELEITFVSGKQRLLRIRKFQLASLLGAMWRCYPVLISIAILILAPVLPTDGLLSPTKPATRPPAFTTGSLKMGKEVKEIKTDNAPAPVGPYSQAALVGSTLYCSGQLALDPKTGEFVGAGDIQAETRQVLKNMGEVLKEAGASANNVVRCSIFLADLGDFAKMNEIYADFFKDNAVLPTRTCVQAGALPKGALVEIDCIAEL